MAALFVCPPVICGARFAPCTRPAALVQFAPSSAASAPLVFGSGFEAELVSGDAFSVLPRLQDAVSAAVQGGPGAPPGGPAPAAPRPLHADPDAEAEAEPQPQCLCASGLACVSADDGSFIRHLRPDEPEGQSDLLELLNFVATQDSEEMEKGHVWVWTQAAPASPQQTARALAGLSRELQAILAEHLRSQAPCQSER
eukprot:tig00020934_g16087.t1